MKLRSFLLGALICSFFYTPLSTSAAAASPVKKYSGRILLQKESNEKAWYVNPVDGKRYYLKDDTETYQLIHKLGLGISNANLAKIPTEPGKPGKATLIARLSGRILLQVQSHGQAWYVNPTDGLRYYLQDGAAAQDLFKKIGLEVSNTTLRTIPMNTIQLLQDPTFNNIAYTVLNNGKFVTGKNQTQVLSLASLTKLMTAMVLLDNITISKDKYVTITQEQLDYPKSLVGNDDTSEVDVRVGDIVSLYDLWVAMLVASSNQAAIALVDASGLSRTEFAQAMKKKTSALGLKRTVFYEPTGLDSNNVTTPREMAIIARAAFNNTEIVQGNQQDNYFITPQQEPSRIIQVTNRNLSLKAYGAEAAKVGYLVEAQRCVALKKGQDIIVIMHAKSNTERNKILEALK